VVAVVTLSSHQPGMPGRWLLEFVGAVPRGTAHSRAAGMGGPPDGSGLDGIAGLNWMVWAVGRDRTTGFAARPPKTLRVHQARSTPLRQPGRRAGRPGWAGWAGWLGSWGSGVEEGLEAEPSGARFSSTRDASSVKIGTRTGGPQGTGQSAFGKPSRAGQARYDGRYEGGAEETIAGTPRHSAARDTIPRSACHSSLPHATRAPAGRSWRCQERLGRDLHSATGAPCEVPTYMPGGRGTSGRQRQPDTPGERAWRERTLLLPGCLASPGWAARTRAVCPPARSPAHFQGVVAPGCTWMAGLEAYLGGWVGVPATGGRRRRSSTGHAHHLPVPGPPAGSHPPTEVPTFSPDPWLPPSPPSTPLGLAPLQGWSTQATSGKTLIIPPSASCQT